MTEDKNFDAYPNADQLVDELHDTHFGASTNKRGLAKKTLELRESILEVFEEVDKPVTVRQMLYLMTSCGAVPKTEAQGYRPVQRQLVLMRRERLIPYHWIADNTRWMRKPNTYDGLGDFFDNAAEYYRQDLWHRSDSYVEVWLEKDTPMDGERRKVNDRDFAFYKYFRQQNP